MGRHGWNKALKLANGNNVHATRGERFLDAFESLERNSPEGTSSVRFNLSPQNLGIRPIVAPEFVFNVSPIIPNVVPATAVPRKEILKITGLPNDIGIGNNRIINVKLGKEGREYLKRALPPTGRNKGAGLPSFTTSQIAW